MLQSKNEIIQTVDQYFTVPQFSKRHVAFSNGSLRWIIYNSEKNGLDKTGAIIRIGRKLLIDETLFLSWVKCQNTAAVSSQGLPAQKIKA